MAKEFMVLTSIPDFHCKLYNDEFEELKAFIESKGWGIGYK